MFNPRRVGNILSRRMIMKYFLRSFKEGNCQTLAKEYAQILVNHLPAEEKSVVM